MMSLLTVPYWQGVHVMQDLGCVVSEKLEIRFEGNLLPHALFLLVMLTHFFTRWK
jgi:hypothetical protein